MISAHSEASSSFLRRRSVCIAVRDSKILSRSINAVLLTTAAFPRKQVHFQQLGQKLSTTRLRSSSSKPACICRAPSSHFRVPHPADWLACGPPPAAFSTCREAVWLAAVTLTCDCVVSLASAGTVSDVCKAPPSLPDGIRANE